MRGDSARPSRSTGSEGGALIRELRKGNTVITPKLDRMFRSALDALGVLAKLKTAGIALHMIDLGGDTTTNGVSNPSYSPYQPAARTLRTDN
jgi:DNA invertase Pin-like site-specific DNA recombinase